MFETIVNIILISICILFHIIVVIFVACWRKKFYTKGLNHTHFGNFFFFLSICLFVLCLILQLIFKPRILNIIFISSLVCPVFLYLCINNLCFCIYLKESSIISKSLSKTICIDLKDENAYFFAAPYTKKKYLEIGIIGKKERIVFSCIGQAKYLSHLFLFVKDFMLLGY